MPNPKDSPAVQSTLEEQTSQREAGRNGTLDTGLEDSFPASDPASGSHTSVTAGRVDLDEADRVREAGEGESYPLVEEALRSVEGL